ncbi:MAG: 4Fe-4S binding protein [Candidatus Verstraetearchaeota archaeon]|jgi:NAD-dependent dihydropyrimidine dehydrogenase PreA subunit|uniref:Ferredoxin n=1 Tax=Thermoproteota archaeon TaxID=2056631 RepID=A0A523BAU2_9CREN|nr:4Fe-4S binding protein [Candidatus Verstraetearchaeota archaeon]TDA38048.1 MAG: ferredoxin [Candidatus Verstraetearchaeota archaeon]
MVSVKVDHEKCNGDAICISVCPTNVFDLKDNKAVATREQDCILCMACVSQCPTQAITVQE